MKNKEVKVYGIVLSLQEKEFRYLSEIFGGGVKKFETFLTSLARIFEENGIDISEIQPTFLCYQEKPGSVDFYYVLSVDFEDLKEFIKEDERKLKILEHIDNTLENEILKKFLKG